MATIDEFLISLRAEFGEQASGKKFEVFCKWFLENDPEWSKKVDKVWLWDDYPNKWQRQDLGTDLVFRDREGLIWAVQAKCYSEHRSTSKGDMNSFLADTGRPEVDRRLWLQTTNKIEAKAEKTYKGQDKPVTVFTLNDFRDAKIDYPSSFAELYQAKVKDKPKPDPHQLKAIEEVAAGLRTSDRGQMIMACGTGKTFTTLWIKEALRVKTTLVLLPSLSLLSQTMREWAWAGNTDFEILNVCSDKSVGKKTEDLDPTDASFPVTSEVEEIAKFLKQPKPKVVFCTYQSSDLIAQAQIDGSAPTFDLAVADEAHRCAGKADAGFATILDGEKIRASKRLFTTATPRYFGKAIKDEAKASDLAVVGMDDEAVFGPVIHKLTFGQAIEQKLLTDYQVVIVGVDEPMVREWIENYEIVSTDPDNQTDARTFAAKIGMLKAVKDYDLKRVISFHSRVAGAKQFSDELVEVANLIEPANRPVGTFLSDYVSGAMKAGDRKEKIDRLKVLEGYDRGILTNARCLAEGVDVPSLDGVAFIDPRGSQVEIIQAVGRAIRKVRGAKVQKKGTIVLPVFIEDGDDPEASIEVSNFKPVWDVLKALRAHDEVLADTLDQYRTNMAKNASQNRENISDKIIFVLPMSVDAQFSSALRTVLVEASTASWEFWFGLLEQFKEREGNCNVAQHLIFEGYKLGQWVSNQRSTKDILSVERRKRLTELGFVWDTYEYAWHIGFKYLQIFHAREGHCNVPGDYKENGYNLGIWVSGQRYKIPDIVKVDQLNKLDFIWDAKAFFWTRNVSLLKQYIEENGHARVPQKHTVNGIKLGNWVSTLRRTANELSDSKKIELDELGFEWAPAKAAWDVGFQCLQDFLLSNKITELNSQTIHNGYKLGAWVSDQRDKKDSLEPDKKDRLDKLGFIWVAHTYAWHRGVSELQKFVERFGHAKVPQGNRGREGYLTPDGYNLSNWVVTVRQKRKNDKLLQQEIEELDELGFIWDPQNHAWEEGFSKLKQFKDREGNCRPHFEYKEGDFPLGAWVTRQRPAKDKLSPERKQRLDALGFIWSTYTEQWEEGFSKLQQFKEREGNCSVLKGYKEGDFNLAIWVGTQRKAKDKLTPERIERLNALGFIWDVLTAQWEEGLSKLKQFKEREGDCMVPVTHKEGDFKLGSWVFNQRTNQDKMEFYRKQKLNELGFIWDALSQKWEEGFSNLILFKKTNGHCSVPNNFRLEGYNLGNWVSKQRKSTESMSFERKQRLTELGFIWDPLSDAWETGFRELEYFKKHNDHCVVPTHYKTEDRFKLGRWVNTQRQNKKADSISFERSQRLTELGFIWDPLSDAWEIGFRELEYFKKHNDHCVVPTHYKTEDGFKLGRWVSRQRASYREGLNSLTPHKTQRLSALGFVWDPLQDTWHEGFIVLTQFQKREGNCRVAKTHRENGFKLGVWCSKQREMRKKLSTEKVKLLDELGFIWDPLSDNWERGFLSLQNFINSNNHSIVPRGYVDGTFQLDRWVQRQRSNKDSLSPEKFKRLEAIGLTWDPLSAQWECGFREFQKYKLIEGHSDVKLAYVTENGFRLGRWVGTQRKNQNKMSSERRQLLDSVGFNWGSPKKPLAK